MDKIKLKGDLIEISREISAWAKPADVLSDKEIGVIFPRAIGRTIERLAKIRCGIESYTTANITDAYRDWQRAAAGDEE